MESEKNATFFVSGHSLGAALATHAAIDIKRTFGTNLTMLLYTFGSPRVGNFAFSSYLYSLLPNGSNQRLTHLNDIVPHLPPRRFRFNHAGDEVWFNSYTDPDQFSVCE